ncbi:NAD(P)H-dependent oxidoreductase, partial [Pelobium sp.]
MKNKIMENILTESVLSSLEWRYATKKFDADRRLDEEQLNLLMEAVRLSPSSLGLQPYQVLIVSNQQIKEQLKAAAYGQSQLADASHIFVFARPQKYTLDAVNEYAENIAKTRGVTLASLQGYIDMMNGAVANRTQEDLGNWNARQAYIALGILLETAALNEIDACPMEGFNIDEFDKILGLSERNLTSVVIAPVGFRA